jgi:hypothetical protein
MSELDRVKQATPPKSPRPHKPTGAPPGQPDEWGDEQRTDIEKLEGVRRAAALVVQYCDVIEGNDFMDDLERELAVLENEK